LYIGDPSPGWSEFINDCRHVICTHHFFIRTCADVIRTHHFFIRMRADVIRTHHFFIRTRADVIRTHHFFIRTVTGSSEFIVALSSLATQTPEVNPQAGLKHFPASRKANGFAREPFQVGSDAKVVSFDVIDVVLGYAMDF
jgi:hypothetical protein